MYLNNKFQFVENVSEWIIYVLREMKYKRRNRTKRIFFIGLIDQICCLKEEMIILSILSFPIKIKYLRLILFMLKN